MKTLFMAKGLPGSGKTFWAKKLQATSPGSYKRINKDDLRAMLDDGKWSPNNEQFVVEASRSLATLALAFGHHAIVDDTNFAPKHEAALRTIAKQQGAQFVVQDFTTVPLDDCLKRDAGRPNPVGKGVIMGMHKQFLQKTVPEPAHDPALPNCVIVDMDGTLAEMTNRGPFEEDKVGSDSCRELVRQTVIAAAEMHDASIIVMSGRSDKCFEATAAWCRTHNVNAEFIHMRKSGDSRRDSIIKRELYEREIKGQYNVIAIFDDRPQVIRECWQALGFTKRIFNVGSGEEF